MSGGSAVRIAAVQATPVTLDSEATIEKACGLLGEAAADGAKLAVLPEAFVPQVGGFGRVHLYLAVKPE